MTLDIPDITSQMYNTKMKDFYKSIPFLQSANSILVIIYVFVFIAVHAFILYKHIYETESRNTNRDIAIMVAFFLFPYLAYLVEQYLYFAVVYIDALIYGKVYEFKFWSLLE